MTHRLFPARVLPSMIMVCLFLPTRGTAQGPGGPCVGPDCPGPAPYPTGPYPNQKYGPYPPAMWNYPGLGGGPYLTAGYPFYGYPGYRGAFGSFWTNGFSLYGPPVPVYGPIPGVFGNSDLVRQWQTQPRIGLGLGYTGWVGTYRASPRPYPPSVGVWPVVESVPGPGAGVIVERPFLIDECLHLSVKVPQPAAEVFVDGVKTVQTGTDRLYESPPLEAGKEVRYELTARWIERGVTFERKKMVTGKPGEVVRVDLTTPDVVVTGR